jgi:hypothetical protein
MNLSIYSSKHQFEFDHIIAECFANFYNINSLSIDDVVAYDLSRQELEDFRKYLAKDTLNFFDQQEVFMVFFNAGLALMNLIIDGSDTETYDVVLDNSELFD